MLYSSSKGWGEAEIREDPEPEKGTAAASPGVGTVHFNS